MNATSAWRPLRTPVFRNLLAANVVSDMGPFMQTVGAAWLMVSAHRRCVPSDPADRGTGRHAVDGADHWISAGRGSRWFVRGLVIVDRAFAPDGALPTRWPNARN